MPPFFSEKKTQISKKRAIKSKKLSKAEGGTELKVVIFSQNTDFSVSIKYHSKKIAWYCQSTG